MITYTKFVGLLSEGEALIINVFLLSVILAIISLFIWEFYKSISKKNLLSLNLKKYNNYSHKLFKKIVASLFYLIEYIFVTPVLILLWFAGLAVVLFLIAGELNSGTVLLIAAALIGAIRILSYMRGEIAKDVAKLFPFMALSIFLLSPNAFNTSIFLEKIKEIPILLNNVLYYIAVVFIIEIVLRILYTIKIFFTSEDENLSPVKSKISVS